MAPHSLEAVGLHQTGIWRCPPKKRLYRLWCDCKAKEPYIAMPGDANESGCAKACLDEMIWKYMTNMWDALAFVCGCSPGRFGRVAEFVWKKPRRHQTPCSTSMAKCIAARRGHGQTRSGRTSGLRWRRFTGRYWQCFLPHWPTLSGVLHVNIFATAV